MLKSTRIVLALLMTITFLSLTACSDDDIKEEVAIAQVSIVEITTPEGNKKEIDLLKIKMASLVENNKLLKTALEERVLSLESKVSLIEQAVTINTGLIETIKIELTSIANKVTSFFKPQKVASKKTYKRQKHVATKPKYKIVGIDQWGAYQYVQLMDRQGNLRLLRKSESVDGWTVNIITKKKVTLVNAKGVLMVLVPQA